MDDGGGGGRRLGPPCTHTHENPLTPPTHPHAHPSPCAPPPRGESPKAVEEVAPAAPAPGEPMDLNTAIQVGWFGVVGAWMLVDGWVDEGG